MKKYYFVGKRPGELMYKVAPFLYTKEEDAWDELMSYPKDTNYRVFEVTIKEYEIGARHAKSL